MYFSRPSYSLVVLVINFSFALLNLLTLTKWTYMYDTYGCSQQQVPFWLQLYMCPTVNHMSFIGSRCQDGWMQTAAVNPTLLMYMCYVNVTIDV